MHRTKKQGVGAHIKFLVDNKNLVRVVGASSKRWHLANGRTAKKATEGVSWVWESDSVDSSNQDLATLFSRLSVNESHRPFYSFGNWGYYTNDQESQVMPGFSPEPPGIEICGAYEIVYVAALCYDNSQDKANIFLRRQPNFGELIIKENRKPVNIGISGRLGQATRSVSSQSIYFGKVILEGKGGKIDLYFGPGYNFYGFSAHSNASQAYTPMPTNASLIVTKLNDNKGRLYKVDAPKAFKLVDHEGGVILDESARFDSQQHETDTARRICKCKHFSFLCRDLGLPCSASKIVTDFLHQHQPYIFAEPGDLWLDIRLTTPNRTYVLARPRREGQVDSPSESSSDSWYSWYYDQLG